MSRYTEDLFLAVKNIERLPDKEIKQIIMDENEIFNEVDKILRRKKKK